jgi:hypothetical protein
MKSVGRTSIVVFAAVCVYAGAQSSGGPAARAAGAQKPVPLKEAKLNIEHNATDHDTGFQGAVDSEGWRRLEARGPGGKVLRFQGLGSLADLGLTELFFETVEPENAEVPIRRLLRELPEGRYTFSGPGQENGKPTGPTVGKALLTHEIPKGPELVSPAEGAKVPTTGVVADWEPVSQTINGDPTKIISYQLIIEQDVEPHRHMIGLPGSLSMYLPPSVTEIDVPDGFLEPGTDYNWEVLAIERSGNQTLSSGTFTTEG